MVKTPAISQTSSLQSLTNQRHTLPTPKSQNLRSLSSMRRSSENIHNRRNKSIFKKSMEARSNEFLLEETENTDLINNTNNLSAVSSIASLHNIKSAPVKQMSVFSNFGTSVPVKLSPQQVAKNRRMRGHRRARSDQTGLIIQYRDNQIRKIGVSDDS